MVSDIVLFINQQLQEMRLSYVCARNCSDNDLLEIQAFLGLLYLIGMKKTNHLNIDKLWTTDRTAPEIYIATMFKQRFHTLVQAITFVDKTTGTQRKQTVNAAPMRGIF